jgi:hypothetical protein
MDKDIKIICRPRCHGKASKEYNKLLKSMVDKMPINPSPPFAQKVWVDEAGEINLKIVDIFK